MKKINLSGLNEIFNNNLFDDYLYNSLYKIILYDIQKTQNEIEDLKNELKNYEDKFKLKSEEFYKDYSLGKIEDTADYFEWSSLYQMYQRSVSRLDFLILYDK